MKFRKKPVVVEAVLFDGTASATATICAMAGDRKITMHGAHEHLHIETLEGTMMASIGDWVIKGVAGEVYPCKSDIFNATYEAV